eukprot:5874469-Pyramimonas_sp.AAC.1
MLLDYLILERATRREFATPTETVTEDTVHKRGQMLYDLLQAPSAPPAIPHPLMSSLPCVTSLSFLPPPRALGILRLFIITAVPTVRVEDLGSLLWLALLSCSSGCSARQCRVPYASIGGRRSALSARGPPVVWSSITFFGAPGIWLLRKTQTRRHRASPTSAQ